LEVRTLEFTLVAQRHSDVAMGQFFQHETGGNSLLIDDFFTADIILREGKGEF
jgi:hypothetical protein